ncbi:HD domain-containing protein [Gorillibacterium sp. sgz5001074]|uniref:HD domain-containing protein n=1 Tax=Gorillibacterium sp. sgz5001074 TaxID=3446695 RepID=UPI003F678E08
MNQTDKLKQQLSFIIEIDRLKHVLRKTKPIGSDRYENDTEHTWHLAMMAVILAEHANEPGLDLLRTVKMLLIHDIVEIDAGDTFAYDEKGHEDKFDREMKAAERLFGMLPDPQGRELKELWLEFEDRETPESRFANALDRLHPMLLNVHNGGQSWKENDITYERVVARNGRMVAEGSKTLWSYAEIMLEEALMRGDLRRGENGR